MASKTTSTKALKAVETVEAAAYDEALPIIEAAIEQVIQTFGVDVQRARLKGIRALAYRALVDHIEAGTLEDLTQRAIADAPHLPLGWGVTPPKRAPKPARKPRAPKAAPADTEEAPAKPAAKKRRASKGSTVASAEGVVIAEQQHIDLTVHEVNPNKAHGCTCGQSYGSKAALSRHLNVMAKAATGTEAAGE